MANSLVINQETITTTTQLVEALTNHHLLTMDNLTQDKLVCFEDFFLILYIGRTRIS